MGEVINSCVSGVINAPIDVVWREIRDFGNLRYFPAAASVELSPPESGCSIGTVRTVRLHDGGGGQEQLLSLSDLHHRIEYAFLDDPAQPFTSYIAQVELSAVTPGRKSLITWRSSYVVTAPNVFGVKAFIENDIQAACIEGLRKIYEG